MEIKPLSLPEVLQVSPAVFGDDRGFFSESWNERDFNDAIGTSIAFVQDNHSRSVRGVLRGLHYQLSPAQGKLVRVAVGAIFDVAVDIRRSSPQFGQWVGVELSADNKHQLWIPPGFAHGFLVLSESADVLYKATTYYDPPSDRSILWNDPDIGIDWPLDGIEPLLSDKDRDAVPLEQADLYD
ncbi:MAG: dTDP-4-dehydrorhamnose 3,5-epimerase [bacterium]|nr:dTDP-4-dehydrorhamnose 3,5-epimerase [bacterium]MCP4968378.1 dTDP-4-dehydrorhamnose 3,5-epimerase [bacterium]